MSILRIPPYKINSTLRLQQPVERASSPVQAFEPNADSITFLLSRGLKNPFAVTAGITDHVNKLLEQFKPSTDLEKVMILFQSLLPGNARFEVEGKPYFGAGPAELKMQTLIDTISNRREILFPEELLHLTGKAGVATDFEYHLLLLTMLRAAGIKCSLKIDERSYVTKVIVELADGSRYGLSVKEAKFMALDNEAISTKDDEALGWFYYLKGQIAFLQFENKRQMAGLDLDPFAQKALNYIQTALTLKPALYGAWYCLGATHRYLGKEKEATYAFAIGHYHEAMFYLESGDGSMISEALGHLNEAVEIYTEFPQAWLEMGKLFHQLGSQNEADRCLDRACRYLKTEEDIDAIKLKAEIKFYKGLVMERQAVLVEPEISEEHERFFENLEKASVDLGEPTVLYNPIIGRFDDYDQRRLEKAIEYFEEAIKLMPGFSNAWASKGETLLKLNRGEEAIAALIRAVKIEPGNPQAWFLLGLAYLEHVPDENPEKTRKIAGSCFARVFKLKNIDQEFVKSLLILAINYASLDQKEEALLCLDIISRYGGKEFASRAWKIRALLIREKKNK